MSAISVLLLEDEEKVRGLWVPELRRLGYVVDAASSCAEALELVRAKPFDVFVFDFLLGDGDALSVMRFARSHGCGAPTIIVSSVVTDHDVMQAGGLAHGTILRKPVLGSHIAAAIQQVLAAAAAAAAAAAEETPGSPFLRARDRILSLDSGAPDYARRTQAILWRLMAHTRVEFPEFCELAQLSRSCADPKLVAERLASIDSSPAIRDPEVRHVLACVAVSRESDTTLLAQASHRAHSRFLALLRTGPDVDSRFWIRMGRVYRAYRLVLGGENLAYVAERAGFADENQLSRVFHDALGATATEIRSCYSLAF